MRHGMTPILATLATLRFLMSGVEAPSPVALHAGSPELWESQALAPIANFSTRVSELNASASLRAIDWTIAVIRLGMYRGGGIFPEQTMSTLELLSSTEDNRRLMIENRKAVFLGNGLFAHPVTVTSEKKGEKIQRTYRFEFGQDTEEAHDEMREFILVPERLSAQKGYLPKNHAAFIERVSQPEHRDELLAITEPILTRNPLKVIARDIATGKIAGFVYPVFVRAKNAAQLPGTWVGMSEWLREYAPLTEDLKDWVMGDIWFTGGGDSAVAAAMLDASYELGKAMGINRFYAYSNPRALPYYWEKYPERRAELTETAYATRVIAPFIFERLKPLAQKHRIRTWADFNRQISRMARRHTRDEVTDRVTTRLLEDLSNARASLALPDTPTPEHLMKLIEFMNVSLKEGGYAIDDPAITFHLKRGSKLARIVPNAFPDILDGPGIGGGFSFVMEYSIKLRDRFEMRFGERLGVGRARWRTFRERRRISRAA